VHHLQADISPDDAQMRVVSPIGQNKPAGLKMGKNLDMIEASASCVEGTPYPSASEHEMLWLEQQAGISTMFMARNPTRRGPLGLP